MSSTDQSPADDLTAIIGEDLVRVWSRADGRGLESLDCDFDRFCESLRKELSKDEFQIIALSLEDSNYVMQALLMDLSGVAIDGSCKFASCMSA